MSDVERLLAWSDAGELIRPATDHPSLADLALALGDACGAPVTLTDNARKVRGLIGDAEHIVLVLVDGLGMNLIEPMPPADPLRRDLAMELHTVFPSSTAPALTTLATGLWPAEHAVPGWFTYLPGPGISTTILPFTDRFTEQSLTGRVDPAAAFPAPVLTSRMTRRVFWVSPKPITRSVFSLYSSGEADDFGYTSLSFAAEVIERRIRKSDGPTFTYFYIPYVDAAEHKHGPAHSEVRKAIARVSKRFDELTQAMRGRARVVLTADHGQIEVRPQHDTTWDRHHELARMLRVPPSCEPRVTAFHVRDGMQERFAAAFRERYADRFALITVEESDALRLFGPVPIAAETRARLGDLLAVPRDLDVFRYEPKAELAAMKGFHGGMHPDEMRIPLIIV